MENLWCGEAEPGLDYYVLDVFTEKRLEGNPLAVVINPGTLTADAMQAIAREMNLSETTFVERRDAEVERREGVRVRIFTTQEELPFAGHPTLGTASLLRAIAPEAVAHDLLSLALPVGKVPVRFEAQSADAPPWPARGEMTQRDPEFGAALDPEKVAALTGLKIDDFDPDRPIQVVSTGTAFAIVPLRSADRLVGLRVRQEETSAYLRAMGARWFYVLGPCSSAEPSKLPQWRARMQFSGDEDPATGSAAGCAISYLVKYRAVPPGQTIHLRQGVEIGRPSNLLLSADLRANGDAQDFPNPDVVNVKVGGSTVLVARGQLFLPECTRFQQAFTKASDCQHET